MASCSPRRPVITRAPAPQRHVSRTIKRFGRTGTYGYLDAAHAEPIQHFYSAHFNPYLNYHRPCAQAEVEVDAKGRKRCFYRRYQTPLETLLALSQPAQYLRPGLTVAVLQRIAAAVSDTEAAQRMQQAKRKLFEQLRPAGFGKK